jgi:antitoxin ParD1/3/4
MPRTITFQPSEQLGEFVEDLVQSGYYNNQSEVIREGLRLLQEKIARSKVKELKKMIEEGENSGDPIDWDADTFLSRMKKGK